MPTDNPTFEAALDRAQLLVACDWKPASEADLLSMDRKVLELVFEIRRGQREKDEADAKQGQAPAGRPITGAGPGWGG